MSRSPFARRTLGPISRLLAASAVSALSACGGGDDAAPAAAAAPVSPAPPAAAVTTTVTGAVVKGPVNGAQVCAYSVVANGRGTALGACTTSDASGQYSFAVPAGSGPLWLEASGGSYTDEATGAAASLPAGSPLRALATANAGSVTAMLTPLTTLALNAAAAAVGSTGTLDAAAFSTAAAQLLRTFNLPATLDIAGTLPAFGAAANAYGAALTVVSQMVANGTALATLLGSSDPQALAAAFATAATPPTNPPVTAPGTTPDTPPATTPDTGGSPTASGTLTVSGATAANAATSLTPRADGFEVRQDSNAATSYRFASAPNAAANQVEVTVAVSFNGTPQVTYIDLPSRTVATCTANCGVTITTPSGATHPVTVSFSDTPLGGNLKLNGSLVGDAPGALWRAADLPGATTSDLVLAGAAVRVLSSADSTIDLGGGQTARSVSLRLSDGSTLALNQSGGTGFSVTRVKLPASITTCSANCNVGLVDSAGLTRLTLSRTTLSDGVVLSGSVDIARGGGSLSSSDAGGFTPVTSNIESLNDTRTLTFSALGTVAQSGLSLVTVETRAGRVVRAQAAVGIANQLFTCLDNGASINTPVCDGIGVAADGRTVSFTNAVLRGGAVGAAARNVTFNGTVVAKGP